MLTKKQLNAWRLSMFSVASWSPCRLLTSTPVWSSAVADVRGERARIYSDRTLRDRVKERFPDAIEWPPTGLPNDCLLLLAPRRAAFVSETEHIVGHGGIALEEVIVPFVRIERRGP